MSSYILARARRLYIKMLLRDHPRLMERGWVAESITRASSPYKLEEYTKLYQLGVSHALADLPETLPEWLDSSTAYRDKRAPGKCRAYTLGYTFASEWKTLTPAERAEIDGDGNRCEECKSFIPHWPST